MEKTGKPTTAGILSIIAGAVQATIGIVLAVVAGTVGGGAFIIPFSSPPRIFGIATFIIILGIVAIVGGIYALRRKAWGLALAGCICALFGPWFILGIPAIIFVAMGKGEFE